MGEMNEKEEKIRNERAMGEKDIEEILKDGEVQSVMRMMEKGRGEEVRKVMMENERVRKMVEVLSVAGVIRSK